MAAAIPPYQQKPLRMAREVVRRIQTRPGCHQPDSRQEPLRIMGGSAGERHNIAEQNDAPSLPFVKLYIQRC